MIAAASDREILDWFGHAVRDEGVFCEPSSAASLAGLANARRDGLVAEGAEVVAGVVATLPWGSP